MTNETKIQRPIVVMGPSGSGKSTVGALLADALSADFIDADDLHPEANRAKMAEGIPLTDEDRWPWLESVAKTLRQERELGRSAVVACSALKRSYRDALRDGAPRTAFVYLDGTPELLATRMGGRRGHFMPTTLLQSQLAALEPLGADEAGVVVSIDQAPQAIVDAAVAALRGIE